MIEARGLVGFSPMNILTVNLLFSTLVFGIAARIYVLPRLRDWGRERVLTAILVLHSFRSEEHTSELQSPCNLVCRLLLEKKKIKHISTDMTNDTLVRHAP